MEKEGQSPHRAPDSSHLGEPLQLARLSRLAQDLALDKETAQALQSRLLATLGGAARALPPERGLMAGENNERDLLLIRGLIERDAPWEEVEPMCWGAFGKNPSDELAARIVEMALLHGNSERVVVMLESFRKLGHGFYVAISDEVRSILVLKLWLERKESHVHRFIHVPAFEKKLTPIEHLYKFWSIHSGSDPGRTFNYYQDYEAPILAATMQYGAQLGLSPSHFYLAVGRVAMGLRYEVAARRALSKIGEGDVAYEEAMRLLLTLKIERDAQGFCVYGRRLNKHSHWVERLKLLYGFLHEARRLSGAPDGLRPALNALLEDLMHWVPSTPEAWATLSQTLFDYTDLLPMLPSLYRTYEDRGLQFLPTALEKALWSPLLEEPPTDCPFHHFWTGVAHLHFFTFGEREAEAHLWRAKDYIEAAVRQARRPLPWTWARLLLTVENWLQKSPLLSEGQRELMLAELRIAQDVKAVQANDLATYLRGARVYDYDILERIVLLARKKKLPELEQMGIDRLGRAFHYRNADLARLWELSVAAEKHDQAWRVASVVHSRGVLHEDVLYRWSFSGENRHDYGFTPLALEELPLLLTDFDADEQRFLQALLVVGPLIPEILGLLHAPALLMKPERPELGSDAQDVQAFFAELAWMRTPRRVLRSGEGRDLNLLMRLPCIMQALPHNRWSSMFIGLVERFGIMSWDWDVARLHAELHALLPNVVSGHTKSVPFKVARWIKNLDSQERAAWQNLVSYSGKVKTARGVDIMATALARLATCFYQNHHLALVSLQRMRMPWHIVGHVEAWILHPTYGDMRLKHGTANRVRVPKPLASVPLLSGDKGSCADASGER